MSEKGVVEELAEREENARNDGKSLSPHKPGTDFYQTEAPPFQNEHFKSEGIARIHPGMSAEEAIKTIVRRAQGFTDELKARLTELLANYVTAPEEWHFYSNCIPGSRFPDGLEYGKSFLVPFAHVATNPITDTALPPGHIASFPPPSPLQNLPPGIVVMVVPTGILMDPPAGQNLEESEWSSPKSYLNSIFIHAENRDAATT